MRGGWRGPLHGIPVGLKDLFDTAGVRTAEAGSLRIASQQKHEVVRRLKAAGAVIVGKQNLHELRFGATSASSSFWVLFAIAGTIVAGGLHTGGSAAAVAAALCYGALGTDADRFACLRPSAASWA